MGHSREIWRMAEALRWPGFLAQDYRHWVRRQAQGVHGVKFMLCLWGIWKWRNNMVFEPSPWPLQEAWRRICHEHDDTVKAMDRGLQPTEAGWLCSRWKLPPTGYVSLCVDGSYRSHEHCMGAGGLLRDELGQWVRGFQAFQAGGNPLLSEAWALKIGLQITWDAGFRDVICNLDCGELLKSLGEVDSRRFLPILDDIIQLLDRPWRVSLSAFSRDCNMPADWLAKRGASNPELPFCLLDTPPMELETLIMRDRLAAL
ncbi:uncharacterized protein LOC130725786 [Lotus japonicus]|uniref:uncharacterized protein LOC130725786 n=1 Tax=Lotus japonicus TaxID=34305 RepID=UPI00258BAC76|nr:uncharacterized protein LOC130725786 [Lotus japonicus]